MSREIKFRAWDRNAQKLLYPDRKDNGVCCGVNTSVIRNTLGDCLHGEWDEDYPLMQYTGLKDRNGVEIYEGDITKGAGVNDVVVYENGSFWLSNPTREYSAAPTGWPKTCYPLFRIDTARYSEVIGNIYENPELVQ